MNPGDATTVAADAGGTGPAPTPNAPLRDRIGRAFQPYLRGVLPREVAERHVAHFRSLDELDAPTRERLEPYVAWHAAALARSEFRARVRGFLIALYTAVPLGLLVLWMAPVLADLGLRSTFSVTPALLPNRLMSSPAGMLLCVTLLVALVALASLRDVERNRSRAARFACIAVLALAGAAIGWFVLQRIEGPADDLAGEQTWRLLAFAIMVFGVFTVIVLANRIADRALRPLQDGTEPELPCSIAVRELVDLLHAIPASEREWANPGSKRSLITRLDVIAQTFDPYLSSFFACGHPALQGWIAKRCAEISASVQELAHVAFSPGPRSHAEFRSRVSMLLVSFLDGTWAQLPLTEAGVPTQRKRALNLRMTLGRIGVVMTPALLLGLYYLLPITAKPEIPASALLSAGVLSITGLVNVINPQLGSDVSMAKSVTEVLRRA
jgi:hypothetical protein